MRELYGLTLSGIDEWFNYLKALTASRKRPSHSPSLSRTAKQRKDSEIPHDAITEEVQTPPIPLPAGHDMQIDTPDKASWGVQGWFIGTLAGAMLLTHMSDRILHTVTHLLAMGLVSFCNLGSLLGNHVVSALFLYKPGKVFSGSVPNVRNP